MKIDFNRAGFSSSLDNVYVKIDEQTLLSILNNGNYIVGLMHKERVQLARLFRDKEISLAFAIKLQKDIGVKIVTQEDINKGLDELINNLRTLCMVD